jgi:hypothetical protein
MMKHAILIICLGVFLIMPLGLHAQTAEEVVPLLVGTVGSTAPDGSILYSVLIASTEEALTDLTISSPLPEGATFVDVFWTPSLATFVGESDGTVTWSLPEMPAQSVIGPFTYRVTFEDVAQAPAAMAATVTSGGQTFTARREDGILQPLTLTGSVTVGAAGTDGLVAVEGTGVMLDIPAGTFDQDITLTFERLPFDGTVTPPETEDLWWCTLYSITTEPAVAIDSPITILLPIRRTSLPGLAAALTYQSSDSGWLSLENTEAAFIAGGGNQVEIQGFTFSPVLANQVIAAGYVEQDNVLGIVNLSNSITLRSSDLISFRK